jgi:hypothetical protein
MDRYLAAAFFIARPGEPSPSEAELLARAGFVPDDGAEEGSGRWAGMRCWASIESLPDHLVLLLRFRQSELLESVGDVEEEVPLEADGALELALRFGAACDALEPDAALVVTHLHQAEREWVLGREWMVLAKDAHSLLAEGVGLSYLHGSWPALATLELSGRDRLPSATGVLVFAGRGAARWW